VGIAGPRVSELLGRTRDLSMYYIEQFILGGIFKVADIYDNKPESKEEEAVWDRFKIIENTKLVEALAKAIVRGSLKEESLYSFLQSHFPNQGK
jgi:dihydroorotase-like cyclic amidohydrolase